MNTSSDIVSLLIDPGIPATQSTTCIIALRPHRRLPAVSDSPHPSTSASSPSSRRSRVYHLDRCSHPLVSEHECSFLARFSFNLYYKLYGSNFHKPASWTVGDAHVSTTATCVDHRSSTANARTLRAAPREFSEELSQAPKNFPVPGISLSKRPPAIDLDSRHREHRNTKLCKLPEGSS